MHNILFYMLHIFFRLTDRAEVASMSFLVRVCFKNIIFSKKITQASLKCPTLRRQTMKYSLYKMNFSHFYSIPDSISTALKVLGPRSPGRFQQLLWSKKPYVSPNMCAFVWKYSVVKLEVSHRFQRGPTSEHDIATCKYKNNHE